MVTAYQEECIRLCLQLRSEHAIAIGKMQKGKSEKKPNFGFWRARILVFFLEFLDLCVYFEFWKRTEDRHFMFC